MTTVHLAVTIHSAATVYFTVTIHFAITVYFAVTIHFAATVYFTATVHFATTVHFAAFLFFILPLGDLIFQLFFNQFSTRDNACRNFFSKKKYIGAFRSYYYLFC